MTTLNAAETRRRFHVQLNRVAYRFADWLSLAATPAFATMAVVTHLNGNPMDAHCSSGFVMPLRGMVPMYIAMSVFHLPPWLKLVFTGRKSGYLDLRWRDQQRGDRWERISSANDKE